MERETAPYQEPPDPLLEAISRLVTAEYPEWHGTATELAQQLQSGGFTPNWIVRRLNAKYDILLQKYGIRYRTRRSKEGKTLLLRWVGVR